MKLIKLAACIAAATALTACLDKDDDSSNSSSAIAIDMEKAQLVVNTNADIAYATYSDAVATAEALKTALTTFKNDPTEANLLAAKKAWLVAREPYGQTEVYRFRSSPIDDDPTTSDEEDGPEGALNAWPLGEALIDYVQVGGDFGNKQIGVESHNVTVAQGGTALTDAITTVNASSDNTIIGNRDIVINEALLDASESGDGHDVISGYHAIEFMLWGQDLNNNAGITNENDRDEAVKTEAVKSATSPVNPFATGGQRPLTDFTTDTNADRRHAYLEVLVDKLIADLNKVQNQWSPDSDSENYRDRFTTLTDEADAKQKLTEILFAMGTLSQGELAGERIQIGYAGNSQEDEHSCFSDNTHRDIWLNAEGVSNSFFGTYAGYDGDLNGSDEKTNNAVSGYGIYDYLNDVGLESLAEQTKTKLAATEVQYTAIDTKARAGEPFDVLIMDANRNDENPVSKVIVALTQQANSMQDIADELGLGDVVDDEGTGCDTQDPNSEC